MNTMILDAAQSTTDALGSEEGAFIFAEQHRSGYPWVTTQPLEYCNLDNAHGASIYLPLGQDLQMILENDTGATQTAKLRDWYTDDQLSFAANTQWNEFIAAYCPATSTPVSAFTLLGPRVWIPPARWRIYLPIIVLNK